jgi:hypothetical protein
LAVGNSLEKKIKIFIPLPEIDDGLLGKLINMSYKTDFIILLCSIRLTDTYRIRSQTKLFALTAKAIKQGVVRIALVIVLFDFF